MFETTINAAPTLFSRRWHIWTIRLLMQGTVLFGLIYFFLVMFQCVPSMWSLNFPLSS